MDLPLPRQEHEHVARTLARQFLDRVDDPLHLVRASPGSSVSGVSGRYRISTGNVRPVTSITGGTVSSWVKWRAKRSVSIVALVTMTFRSGRCGSSCWR